MRIQQPDPPAYMSYPYEDDVYGYNDGYGGHGNHEYDEYESYSDHNEPDHCGFEDNNYNADHEDGQLEDEGNEVYELSVLVYDDDEMRELKELERMVDEEGYKPQGLDFKDAEVHQLRELEHEHQVPYELEHELGHNDTDAHYGRYEPQTLESSGVPQRAEPKPKGPGRRMHAHHYHTRTLRNTPGIVHPVSTPPAPIPLECDSPHWNQKGHMTALKSGKSAPSRTHPTSPPRTTSVTSIPPPTRTHYAHPHTQNLKPNTNELCEPIELKPMFAMIGHAPLCGWIYANRPD